MSVTAAGVGTRLLFGRALGIGRLNCFFKVAGGNLAGPVCPSRRRELTKNCVALHFYSVILNCENQDSLIAFVQIEGRMEKIDTFCGSTLPKPVMSNGPRLKLEFHAVYGSRYSRGFKAAFSFIQNFGIKIGVQLPDYPCAFVFNSNETRSGYFYSPNYPGFYPRDTECYYFFHGNPGEKIHLHFNYFDVEGVFPCEAKSASDYVEFSNFISQDRKYEKHCGQLEEFDIESDRRFFRVTFKSNDRLDGTGFNATYQFVDKVEAFTTRTDLTNRTTNIKEMIHLKRSLLTRVKQVIPFVKYSKSASIAHDNENLVVNNGDKNEQFPLVWLRDNCRCASCFDTNSNSRIINWNTFDIYPKIKRLLSKVDEDDIILHWRDDHVSKFDMKWLRQRIFCKDVQEKYLKENYRPEKVKWGKDNILSLLKQYEFNDVVNDNALLYKWLLDLATYGVAFLQNTPQVKHECKTLANKIAFIRKTHYEEEFDVKDTVGATNVAYSNNALQLHTDLPYYEYTPGVTFLHCLVQTQNGGESLLADGLFAAEKLRKEDKESFDILSNVDVNWLDIGSDQGETYHSIYRAPVISLDSNGKIYKILHSVPQRDSYFTTDIKLVRPWYKAMRLFLDIVQEETFKFKLQPGQLMAMDNTRLLHGRLAFKDTESNRHITGCQLDWDEIYSKIRILKEKSIAS
ncbi:hypothetical protein FQA39_LY13686 [Lamprigera yunnana]|nr:hypothetical protein FQA39_LY13686 [Lamprigera yunnana]